MADAIGTISGISSGIQWRDMVDQIIAIESRRTVDPLTARQKALDSTASSWVDFQSVVGRFRDAAKAVRDATAISSFSTSASKSTTTSRDLVSATTDTTAQPGSYAIEVQQLATAEKLNSIVATTATTALGVTGAFVMNTKSVTVSATDTLTTLRDKINALNTGATPSGVSASILRTGVGARLILTADRTGATGIELTDDASGTLQSLGFIDSTKSSNITDGGLTQTHRFASRSATFATVLGMSLPSPTTIRVGGKSISIDLSVDSLSSIAARINAATGLSDSASIVAETVGSTTYQRLQTSLAVESDVAQSADSVATLAVLGFTKAGRGGVAQVVKSANTFTDAANASANATASTKLTDIEIAGSGLGLTAGDVVTINGKRGDGTTLTRTVTIGATTTMQDLLDSANNATSGFGAGSRTAVMSMGSGRLTVTDAVAGDSQLGLSITVAKGGSTISLGSFGTDGGTVGRSRQITAGVDSRIMVDDQVVTRSSNAISDVIAGVTLNLLAAEVGTTIDFAVTRDTSAAVTALNGFASAYNEVRTWADTNSAVGKPLAGNSALRGMVNSLSSSLLQSVTGLTGTYTTAAQVGLVRDRDGVLSLDSAIFTAALASNYSETRNVLSMGGVPTDSEVTFASSTDVTKASATPYAIVISQAATAASVTGAAFGTYVTAGTPDTMTITDVSTGRSGSVTLTNGDSAEKIAAGMNSLFTTQKMGLVASVSGGAVTIVANDYGTTGGFTVGYTAGSADGTAQLGISATSYAGLNVAGTLGGYAATGRGRELTGDTGTDVAGLKILYTGTTARAAGTLAYTVGVGGMLYNAAAGIARDLDGLAVKLSNLASDSASAMSSRIADAQDRVASRRAQLIRQFTAMESAMTAAQSIASSLSQQIQSLSASQNNNN